MPENILEKFMNSANPPVISKPIDEASLARDRSCSKVATFKAMPNWQHEYKSSFTNIEQLCKKLDLNIDQLPISTNATHQFKLTYKQRR